MYGSGIPTYVRKRVYHPGTGGVYTTRVQEACIYHPGTGREGPLCAYTHLQTMGEEERPLRIDLSLTHGRIGETSAHRPLSTFGRIGETSAHRPLSLG